MFVMVFINIYVENQWPAIVMHATINSAILDVPIVQLRYVVVYIIFRMNVESLKF
jgi:hypothetical protein